MKHRVGTLAVALLLGSIAMAAGTVESGPQTGKNIPGPFHPLNLTGSQAGKKHCLV